MKHTRAFRFTLPDQYGTPRKLSEFSGKRVLLYFYPKDMTPGCTLETIGFQELKQNFEKENTIIIGISKDTVASHEKFCKRHDLDIILLSDTEITMIEKYGVWQEKSMFGKKYMGISRESFLIDEQGKIIHHWEKVNPIKHPVEVLKFIQTLKK